MNIYKLIRSYLQTLGKRLGFLGKYELKDHVEALNSAFELLIGGV